MTDDKLERILEATFARIDRGEAREDLRETVERLAAAIAGQRQELDQLKSAAERRRGGQGMTEEELHLCGKMLALLYQYRDDLRHGVPPDSRPRRLEAVEALLSQILALPAYKP